MIKRVSFCEDVNVSSFEVARERLGTRELFHQKSNYKRFKAELKVQANTHSFSGDRWAATTQYHLSDIFLAKEKIDCGLMLSLAFVLSHGDHLKYAVIPLASPSANYLWKCCVEVF